ncbi:MAG: hypothetical protein ACFFD7_12135 [Candidatus Thorarchaeota archaeon]
MKEGTEENTSQDDTKLLIEAKKDFFTQLFTDIEEGFNFITEQSGEFFLNLKKDVSVKKDRKIDKDREVEKELEIKTGEDLKKEAKPKKEPTIKKQVVSDWQQFKLWWKNIFENLKNLDPKYKRFKKLYEKMKAVELKISEIKEDTAKIKLEISEVALMIEQLMEGHEDLEKYMKENLGSDWKILKNHWKRCKKGEISKWEFAKIGLSKVGKNFAGIFIKV